MIIPIPATVTVQSGAYQLGNSARIVAGRGAAATAKYLSLQLRKRTGHALILDTGGQGAIRLNLDRKLWRLGDEGYRLTVAKEGVTIVASKAAGLFYGVQSVLQMMDLERAGGRGNRVPCVTIDDKPRYAWRGFMLDSARHFQSPATIRGILDQMAYLKLNVLHWHLTDDTAWRVEIKRYPRLTEFGSVRAADEPGGSGFYSQKELRAIVAYAAARHITVVPEMEMPAHSTAAMACFPELTCSGTHTAQGGMGLSHFDSPEGGTIFCASREETYTWIENVLAEVMGVFPSPVIHLGGDERPDGIWSKCPRCTAMMERLGLKSESALQAVFMKRVAEFVNRHGRRTMAWCQTVEHGLPDKQIAEDWYFGHLKGALELGNDAVNANEHFTYLDYPNFPGRQKPGWMKELSAERAYQFNPTPAGLTAGQAKKVLGSEASLWTEFIEDDDINEALYPRLLALCEVMWSNPKGRKWAEFQQRTGALEPVLNAKGIQYAELPSARPVKLARAATVTTSMDCDPIYPPERAFDGKYVRCFWTATPPKAGDHLTVTLKRPAKVKHLRVYTGTDFEGGMELLDGALEVSTDGTVFRKVADISGRQADTDLAGEEIRAVRVVVTKDMEHRLAITEIVLS